MMLYVNGDSHSYGIHLENHQKFGYLVAKYFNIALENHARIGASNARIIRTTREYLAHNSSPGLVLVGWSTWEREEWQHQGQYYDVNSSGHDGLPEEFNERYKTWVTEQTQDTLVKKSNYWHNEIYQFHCELEQQNIPHLFFNCLYNFFEIPTTVDWNDCYIGPYENDLSFYWYLKNHGYATDEWYHYGADGNQIWADVLIEYIKQHKLL